MQCHGRRHVILTPTLKLRDRTADSKRTTWYLRTALAIIAIFKSYKSSRTLLLDVKQEASRFDRFRNPRCQGRQVPKSSFNGLICLKIGGTKPRELTSRLLASKARRDFCEAKHLGHCKRKAITMRR